MPAASPLPAFRRYFQVHSGISPLHGESIKAPHLYHYCLAVPSPCEWCDFNSSSALMLIRRFSFLECLSRNIFDNTNLLARLVLSVYPHSLFLFLCLLMMSPLSVPQRTGQSPFSLVLACPLVLAVNRDGREAQCRDFCPRIGSLCLKPRWLSFF